MVAVRAKQTKERRLGRPLEQGCRDGGAEPVPERLGEIRQPFRKFIVVRQAAARTHGQEVSLGARIARFGTCGALLELARFPLGTISETASHAGGSPWMCGMS